MKFLFGALCSLLSITAGAQSTDSLYLEPLLQEVISSNPALLAAQANHRREETKISQARSWNAPMVSVEFMDNPITSLNFPKNGMMRRYALEQMIPFPGKISSAETSAQASAASAHSSSEAYKRTLIAETKKQYAMLYSIQRRLSVNQENQTLLQQMISAVQAKYSVGQATQADVLRMQIELTKLENEFSSLQQEERMAEGMINALRSKPTGTPIGTIPVIALPPLPENETALEQDAMSKRNELHSMQAEIEMSRADVSMSQKEQYPDLQIGLAYKELAAMPDTWELMIGISIPFAPWASGKYSGKIEEQQLAVQQKEHEFADMRNMIRFDVYDKWSKAKASWEKLQRYETSVLPSTRQTFEALRSAYIANKADFLSLIDAVRMVQMYTMEYYEEAAQYLSYRADLERAAGTELP
ncbi:MAG: TolC family protein [Bacteroidetes bacterium]|nr:TolC family protein [Bacteroidota bacterium]